MSQPAPGWAVFANDSLLPGAHAIVFGNADTCVEARIARFEVRDTLCVVSHGPEVRFAFLFRKPIVEATVVGQVLATGTGAFNVGACRVAYASESDKTPTVGKGRPGERNPGCGPVLPHYKENWGVWAVNNDGRWPTNVVFIHGPECTLIGERRIQGHKGYPNGPGGSSSQFSQKGTKTTRTSAWAGHADGEGKETISEWSCQEGCPVALLDSQSGFTHSDGHRRGERHGNVYGGGKGPSGPNGVRGHEDAGGASRFYPQFKDEAELEAWFERLIEPVSFDRNACRL